MHRSVPLRAGQSGQDGSNGCQIKFLIISGLNSRFMSGSQNVDLVEKMALLNKQLQMVQERP